MICPGLNISHDHHCTVSAAAKFLSVMVSYLKKIYVKLKHILTKFLVKLLVAN